MSQDQSDGSPLSAANVWNDDIDRPDRVIDDSRAPRTDHRPSPRPNPTDATATTGDEPRRVRVRRRRRRSTARRLVAPGLAVLVASLIGGAVVLGRDALAVRDHLLAVQREAALVQDAVVDDDLDGAREAAATASAEARAAAQRSDGPLWGLAGGLPLVGDDVRLVGALVDVAVAATVVADVAVTEAAPLVTGELELLRGPRQVDLDLLLELSIALDAVDATALRAAVEAVRVINPDGLVAPELVSGRSEVLDLSTRALAALDRTDAALELLPSLFGADAPRTYLMGLQTNAELRGTGGLMTYFSAISADGGRLDVLPAVRENQLADQAAAELEAEVAAASRPTEVPSDETVEAPLDEPTPDPTDAPTEPTPTPMFVADADADFAQRYDHLLARSDVGNVNVDPDLTSAGPVLTQIANQTQQTYDGVIMLDPVGLQQLLAGGPPLQVPSDLSQPPLPNPIPIDQLAQVLLIDNYNVLGGDNSSVRQPYLKAVAAAAIERIFADLGDPRALLDNFGRAVATRHLQIWVDDLVDEQLIDELGAAGRMPRPSDGTDVIAVTGNNAAADKKDVHVGHHLTATFDLRDLRRATAGPLSSEERLITSGGADVIATRSGTLDVQMVNPLQAGQFDDYIIGSAEPQQLGGPHTIGNRDPNGPARTWFTVWNPLGFGTRSLTVDGERQLFGSGNIHELAATDYFLEVPLQSTGSFRTDLIGPVGMVLDGDELVYTLTLWRQAKAIPDVWDLTINAPADLVVSDATFVGGGIPTTGFGPDTPTQLALESNQRGIHLTGGVTEDVVLTIRFARR